MQMGSAKKRIDIIRNSDGRLRCRLNLLNLFQACAVINPYTDVAVIEIVKLLPGVSMAAC